jgi:hypothetical protein
VPAPPVVPRHVTPCRAVHRGSFFTEDRQTVQHTLAIFFYSYVFGFVLIEFLVLAYQ